MCRLDSENYRLVTGGQPQHGKMIHVIPSPLLLSFKALKAYDLANINRIEKHRLVQHLGPRNYFVLKKKFVDPLPITACIYLYEKLVINKQRSRTCNETSTPKYIQQFLN